MPLAVVTASHSPLMRTVEPRGDARAAVDAAFAQARAFAADFRPDLVVVVAPDHYNGMFYDLMPPFCVGTAAESVGDYGTARGPLAVDREAARHVVREVLAAGIDLAMSERMVVDHGFAQPLELLFGAIDAVAAVPVFINSVAVPFGPVRRTRRLGEALGRALLALDRRVLLLGSGGLSHDPPLPTLEGAPPEVAARLIAGRHPTPEERAGREARVRDAGLAVAAGEPGPRLNPDWDRAFLDLLAEGRLTTTDTWTNTWITAEAGNSAHEVRTWLACYAALATAGPYAMRGSFYRPIPEWIAGFGITTAETRRNA
ncbi:3-carboxyethylcatechol 2,3-dioxygenase [Actinoallomurus iriomotensis]|uniref:2,3-dihydroxyphenylpropionate/2,3-dihydroxicinnamic acid 1,2-dioxygenase n=1 Tax=Actinoallomurus iriomotensis TaxID=478107 RepID=A0A9W6VSY5_9ACTN|nr:3-carboxyethylcatechol 2,3-dioxygenase [Actinoallomurus iriomotensis]GLY77992.1 2,3-dihydroxyphenylpropionate/2,3-dihydroxicinnamic acid 1,2-dioxygenase [Actinoallomurus iriomotensis]